LADIIVKEIVQFRPNTPYGQEFTKRLQKYSTDPVVTLQKVP